MICEICEHDLVVDKHHWSKTETSYLCPNCHAIYERIIRWKKDKKNTHKTYKSYTKKYAISQIKKYLVGFNNEKNKERFNNDVKNLLKHIWHERTYWRNDDVFKRDKEITLSCLEHKIIEIRGCEVCLFNIVIDVHHFGSKDCDKSKFFGRSSTHRSNRKSIHLCPNHHTILHRILKDRDGTKYNLKEKIIDEIKKVKK